jgi:hypothetical protein
MTVYADFKASVLLSIIKIQQFTYRITVNPVLLNFPISLIFVSPNFKKIFMKKFTLLLIGAIGLNALIAQNNPTYEWMKNEAQGTNDQYITTFDNDNQGNFYCGGAIRNFPAGTYTYFNNGDSILFPGTENGGRGFLAKIDSNGVAQWTKDFTQGSQEGVRKVVVSPSQELFVTSYCDQAIVLDGIDIPNRAIYVFRYDLEGVLQSHVEFEVDDTFYSVDDMSVDQFGNAYIVGFFNGSITFGSTTISASNGGIFHVKIDINGNVMWIQQFSGRTWDIEIANDGNVLIAGNCPSSAQFGSFTGGSTGFQLPFIVKLDSADGTPLFLHTPACYNGGEARSIVQDTDDNIYLGGFFGRNFGPITNSNLSFGDFSITPIGGNTTTGFIAKYSSSGNPVWAKTMGGKGRGHAHKMALRNDVITIRGEMSETCLFPNGNDSILIRTFLPSPYFATIDTTGLWLGARGSSFAHAHIFDFLQTNTGSLFFTGKFASTFAYNDDQDSIMSQGNLDGVIAKLNDISTVYVDAPDNLQVTGHGSSGFNATTDLIWTDNSDDEFGFFFFAKDQNGSTVDPHKVATDITEGTVGFLWDGLIYNYEVYSFQYDMLSEPSNVVVDTAIFTTGIASYSLNNLNNLNLNVYPNPTHDKINISSSENILSIALYNLEGKQVLNKTYSTTEVIINLESLPKGLYVINIIFKDTSLSKRILLK